MAFLEIKKSVTVCTGIVAALALSGTVMAGPAVEDEACGDNTNGGCNSDPIAFGQEIVGNGGAVAGTAWALDATRDTDWYQVDVTDPDGDGQATISSNLVSQFPGVTFIIDVGGGDCSTIGVIGEIGYYTPGTGDSADAGACVPAPGTYVVFAATGNPDGSSITDGYPCGGGDNDYTLTVSVIQTGEDGNLCFEVNPACVGAEGSCIEANGSIGCDDSECCTTVCNFDPFCCDTEWDESCVDAAFNLCGIFVYDCDAAPAAGAPANDCCTDPEVVGVGESTLFDTTLANTDGPEQEECNSAMNDLQIWSDIWYLVQADATAPLTLTCCFTADFDTKIAAYDVGAFPDWDCAVLLDPAEGNFIACNEDCEDSIVFTSELTINALEGNYYMVRLGGYLQEIGTGTFSVSQDVVSAPVNDLCEDAIEIAEGATEYSSVLANTDGLAHVDCMFDGQTYQDVWFSWTPAQDGEVTIGTCNNAGYDTDMVVYVGCAADDCPYGDEAVLACNDDGDGCAGFSSEVTVTVECGQCYTIRVGGWDEGDEGEATLTIAPAGGVECGGCSCEWDLSGDCDVDAEDLATLLAAWGAPYGAADLASLLAEWGCDG